LFDVNIIVVKIKPTSEKSFSQPPQQFPEYFYKCFIAVSTYIDVSVSRSVDVIQVRSENKIRNWQSPKIFPYESFPQKFLSLTHKKKELINRLKCVALSLESLEDLN